MNILTQQSAASDQLLGAFWFGGKCSRDYGLILTEPPRELFAERDVETVAVAGRNGDLVIDNGRYKNKIIPFKCALIPSGEHYRETALRLSRFLQPGSGYYRMETTFTPGYYRMARINSSVSLESLAEQAGVLEIEFDFKPQRFLISGEQPISMAAPGELYNEHFPSLPLIRVTGTGDSTLTVAGRLVEIFGQTQPIWLDCDVMNAYSDSDGIKTNQNHIISAPEFPVLETGSNQITWSGGIESLEIIPRWWTL